MQADNLSILAQLTPGQLRTVEQDRLTVRRRKADHIAEGNAPDAFAEWHGSCSAPIMLRMAGTVDTLNEQAGLYAKARSGDEFHAAVRCRKCAECDEYRSKKWGARGHAETVHAAQTWFLTLTYGPQSRARFAAAIAEEQDRLGDIGEPHYLYAPERWEVVRPLAARDIQLFLKRLRKAGVKCRYLAAVEKHKDGNPHVHMLLHVQAGHELPDALGQIETKKGTIIAVPVVNKVFASHWRHGFVMTKGPIDKADAQPAFYCSKYIAKDRAGRVQASSRYGRAGFRPGTACTTVATRERL